MLLQGSPSDETNAEREEAPDEGDEVCPLFEHFAGKKEDIVVVRVLFPPELVLAPFLVFLGGRCFATACLKT